MSSAAAGVVDVRRPLVSGTTGDRAPASVTRKTSIPPEWLLLHGIRNMLRSDDAVVVAGLVDYMYEQYGMLRFLSRVVERTRRTLIPPAITLLGALKGFLLVRDPAVGGDALWVARLANERRAIGPYLRQMPELEWREIAIAWSVRPRDIVRLVGAFVKTAPRIVRITRRLHERYAGYKVLRVAELIGYYMRYKRVLASRPYSLAVMSSHSNPHGIALNVAARQARVPTVLITHGMPVRPVARLSYDLGVVHCADAQSTYEEEGCAIARVFLHGRREHLAPLPDVTLRSDLTVGVFLCKDVNAAQLRALLRRLRDDARVSRIIVRPHPFNMWADLSRWIVEHRDRKVKLSADRDIMADVAACDVVLAGNTSVHIEAVIAGRPSAYVPRFDRAADDMHHLVEHGLIFPLGDDLRLDPDALLRFYRRPEWQVMLRRFANVDETGAAVAARASDAMRALAAGVPA